MYLVYGSYEEAREWIGKTSSVVFCESIVNWSMIKFFCALVEDANPCYWDQEYAYRRFRDIPSPPGMLMVWSMPLPWAPARQPQPPLLASQVPLPGNTLINVETDTEFFHPICVEDVLNIQETIVDVSPEKVTRLGRGHFLKSRVVYRNQLGTIVAQNTNVMFRYTPNPE
jgi:hypothetical protein